MDPGLPRDRAERRRSNVADEKRPTWHDDIAFYRGCVSLINNIIIICDNDIDKSNELLPTMREIERARPLPVQPPNERSEHSRCSAACANGPFQVVTAEDVPSGARASVPAPSGQGSCSAPAEISNTHARRSAYLIPASTLFSFQGDRRSPQQPDRLGSAGAASVRIRNIASFLWQLEKFRLRRGRIIPDPRNSAAACEIPFFVNKLTFAVFGARGTSDR